MNENEELKNRSRQNVLIMSHNKQMEIKKQTKVFILKENTPIHCKALSIWNLNSTTANCVNQQLLTPNYNHVNLMT